MEIYRELRTIETPSQGFFEKVIRSFLVTPEQIRISLLEWFAKLRGVYE